MVGVSRSQQRGPIGSCSGKAPTQTYSNGQLPLSILCPLPFAPGHRLRADAAVALMRLNDSYKGRFGDDICLTDSYRSLASQYSVAARKPGLAARPGTSEHGWGLAIDMCAGPDQPGSVRRAWFLANAPKFGWDNPQWARPGTGSRPEPWHWEFLAGEAKTSTSQD
jgi:LAS superfamily LD-carboxypeptidase LdcB